MKKAMVVDDSEFQRNLITSVLNRYYDSVIEAENGREAVEKYKEHSPDFVTMDINMPVMDGLDATDEITNYDEGAVIIMCTSVEQNEVTIEAIKNGASGYLIKPIHEHALLKENIDKIEFSDSIEQQIKQDIDKTSDKSNT